MSFMQTCRIPQSNTRLFHKELQCRFKRCSVCSGGINIELSNIRPVGGCIQLKGELGLLFLDDFDVLPVRLVTECRHKLLKGCSHEICQRYKIGFAGSHKISWRNKGVRI